jgi:hypothetical protein
MSIYERFKRTWNDGQGGFGRHSYADARAAGYSNAEIQAALGGRRVGTRAQDMIGAGVSAEAGARAAQAAADSYKAQLGSYQQQIQGFQSQVSNLSNQYQGALQKSAEYQKQASDWQEQFKVKSADYDRANEEAERYRNEAVGRQLQSIRSGATQAGSNASSMGGGESLARGGTRFQSGDSQLSDQVKEETGLTDSVLNRKGPVVERMVTAQARQTAPTSRPNQSLASGRASGYYSSRFG